MRIEAEVKRTDEEGSVEVQARIPAHTVAAHMDACLSDIAAERCLDEVTEYASAVRALGEQETQRAVLGWFIDHTMTSALQVLDQPVACAPKVHVPDSFSLDEDVVYSLCTYLLPRGTLSSVDPVEVRVVVPDAEADSHGMLDRMAGAWGFGGFDVVRAAEDALIERLDIAIPDALLDFALEQAGGRQTREGLRREVCLMTALDALFRDRLMLITKAEIDEVLDMMIPKVDAEGRQAFILSGQMPLIEEHVRREKAHQWLIETMICA